MTTGDISNNIRKMRSRLKEIKYSENFDVNLLVEGQPAAYLPMYHYAFTNYSQPLAKLILDKGIELFGKSDARFMEAVYKILRDVFAYKPPITKEQFFSKGFAERKVIMCTDILQLVKRKHTELNPAPSKTAMKTSVRPKSAAETKHLPMAVAKTKPDDRRGEPIRHLSSSASHPHPVRHVARRESTESSESSEHGESVPRPLLSAYDTRSSSVIKHVSIQSPRENDQISPRHSTLTQGIPQWRFEDSPDKLDHDIKSHFMTPSVKKVCTKSVEMVTMPKVSYDTQLDRDTSIVEIRAQTRDSLLQSPVSTSNIDIASLYQTVETLSDQVKTLVQAHHGDGNAETEGKIDVAVSKIENLTARLLLLENRMSIIEAKMDSAQGITKPMNSQFASNHVTAISNQSALQPSLIKTTENQSSPSLQLTNQQSQVKQAWKQSTPSNPDGNNGSNQLSEVKKATQGVIQSDILNGKHVYTRDMGRGDSSMNHSSLDSNGLFSGPGNSFAEELKSMGVSQTDRIKETSNFSLNYSPIRRVNNGIVGTTVSANEDTFALEAEDDARRSSTPTFGGTFYGDSSLQCDISHMETKDAVSRIHNMMKETTQMMKNKAVVKTLQSGTAQSEALQPPQVDSIN